MKEIGPDLGEGGEKYTTGVRPANGSIYCAPGWSTKYFLKITPKGKGDAEVEVLENIDLTEQGGRLWASGAMIGNDMFEKMDKIAMMKQICLHRTRRRSVSMK